MYCTQCGKEINGNARFCPYCGHQVKSDTYTLTIVRPSQFYAFNPAVEVTVDGERKYDLKKDSSIKIPVTPGEHIITFKWGPRERTVKRTVNGDVALYMRWNRMTGSIMVE